MKTSITRNSRKKGRNMKMKKIRAYARLLAVLVIIAALAVLPASSAKYLEELHTGDPIVVIYSKPYSFADPSKMPYQPPSPASSSNWATALTYLAGTAATVRTLKVTEGVNEGYYAFIIWGGTGGMGSGIPNGGAGMGGVVKGVAYLDPGDYVLVAGGAGSSGGDGSTTRYNTANTSTGTIHPRVLGVTFTSQTTVSFVGQTRAQPGGSVGSWGHRNISCCGNYPQTGAGGGGGGLSGIFKCTALGSISQSNAIAVAGAGGGGGARDFENGGGSANYGGHGGGYTVGGSTVTGVINGEHSRRGDTGAADGSAQRGRGGTAVGGTIAQDGGKIAGNPGAVLLNNNQTGGDGVAWAGGGGAGYAGGSSGAQTNAGGWTDGGGGGGSSYIIPTHAGKTSYSFAGTADKLSQSATHGFGNPLNPQLQTYLNGITTTGRASTTSNNPEWPWGNGSVLLVYLGPDEAGVFSPVSQAGIGDDGYHYNW